MRYDKKGTRELYIKPYRLSYKYSDDLIELISLYPFLTARTKGVALKVGPQSHATRGLPLISLRSFLGVQKLSLSQ